MDLKKLRDDAEECGMVPVVLLPKEMFTTPECHAADASNFELHTPDDIDKRNEGVNILVDDIDEETTEYFLNHTNPYRNVNGYIDNIPGELPGLMFGLEFYNVKDKDQTLKTAYIVNTEDRGPCYVGYEAGTRKTKSLGPVDHVCLVGSSERAYGLYVPFSNTECIDTAMRVLNSPLPNMYLDYCENPKIEGHEHHECKCGGHCDGHCNGCCGKCNGNCSGCCGKCKH